MKELETIEDIEAILTEECIDEICESKLGIRDEALLDYWIDELKIHPSREQIDLMLFLCDCQVNFRYPWYYPDKLHWLLYTAAWERYYDPPKNKVTKAA